MNDEDLPWNIPEEDENKRLDTSDLWIVPYADFMTVLMIFFLMMYAFAVGYKSDHRFEQVIAGIQEEMGGSVNTELVQKMIEQEKTDQITSKFDETVQKLKLNNVVTITSTGDHIKVVFANPVLFGSGKAELKSESQELLHDLAQTILAVTDNEIVVEGHTDNVPLRGTGRYKSNWELSIARSMQVVNHLIGSEKLDPKRFASAGYGEFRPIVPNDSEEGRAQNRRIEIDIAVAKKAK